MKKSTTKKKKSSRSEAPKPQRKRKLFVPKNLAPEPIGASSEPVKTPPEEVPLNTTEKEISAKKGSPSNAPSVNKEISKKSSASSKVNEKDWPQKTIRMHPKLFAAIESTAKALKMKDKDFCILALTNEVKNHTLASQEALLARVKELQEFNKETI